MASSGFLAEFNDLTGAAATDLLLDCCAARSWAEQVVAGRPFASVPDALAASDAAFATMPEAAVDEALSGHPRIGERAQGAGRSADWSRQEQSGVGATDGPASTADQIRAGNEEYQRRFDRVFLIRAAGRDAEEVLAELLRRLDNDPRTEALEVREQLRQITSRRLEHLLTEGTDR